jgi:hypothetical protein
MEHTHIYKIYKIYIFMQQSNKKPTTKKNHTRNVNSSKFKDPQYLFFFALARRYQKNSKKNPSFSFVRWMLLKIFTQKDHFEKSERRKIKQGLFFVCVFFILNWRGIS